MENGTRRKLAIIVLTLAILGVGVVSAQSDAAVEPDHPSHAHGIEHYAHTALHASHVQHAGHPSHGHDESAHP